jgi:AcrR family transcriptional regulator
VVENTLLDTRARILRAALDEFAARGYHATSVREIAERVGITKTAVLYHFPGKVDILGALAEPMVNDLDQAMDAAEPLAPAAARWAAIEGLLEVWLTHRYLLRLNLQDLAMAGSGPFFHRFRDGTLRANILVAGPGATFDGRVLAAQAIAMLSDPVILFADAPIEDLRSAILRGVRRLLDGDPLPSSGAGREYAAPVAPVDPKSPTRSRRGRPPVMSQDMVDTARQMYDAGDTADEIAATLGVSRATIYRHVPAAND